MNLPSLPKEPVHRTLPVLRDPDDAQLFAAEVRRVLPAISVSRVTGDFFPFGWQGDLDGWRGTVKHWITGVQTRREPLVCQPGRAPLIATDKFSNGYFHWVTETLPRLWWLRDQLGTLELLLPAFARQSPYMGESLALFPDLATKIADAKTRWRLDSALLVPALAPTGNFRPQFVVEVGAAWRIRSGARAPYRKLYVSRSKAARRRISNEAELVKVLKGQGFETVNLEGKPFADQVKLLAETSHLISNHGAGLTNLLFMVPGTRVTEVRLRGDQHNNCYFSLARAVGVEYDYRLAGAVGRGSDSHSADLVVDSREFL